MQTKHLIDTQNLSKETTVELLRLCKTFKENPWQTDLLKQKTIATLFFESSTRTRSSFELAAKRLGATVLNLDVAASATKKGESLLDTLWTLEAMDVDAFVIRHAEEATCQYIAKHLKTKAAVINAGNGTLTHPSQALLDAFTMSEYFEDFSKLKIAIVGDIRHSRVAHSNIHTLKTLGVKDIRLVGPKAFLPDVNLGCETYEHLQNGLHEVDVVMMLRIQKERIQSSDLPCLTDYTQSFGLTQAVLQQCCPKACVMHPGPMNREVEITSEVADSKRSLILSQVKNGVFMRQAILKWLLN